MSNFTVALAGYTAYGDGTVHGADPTAAGDSVPPLGDYSSFTPYYVDSAAVGGGNGAIGSPWTPEEGLANALAGDVVYFRGGTYNLPLDLVTNTTAYYSVRGVLNPANSGTAAQPVAFVSFPSETVILNGLTDAGHLNGEHLFVLGNNDDKEYITFDGFTIQADSGVKMAGVRLSGTTLGTKARGLSILNCIIDGGSTAIPTLELDNRDGLRLEDTTGISIYQCLIKNCNHDANAGNTVGVKMYRNDYPTFDSVEVFGCSGGIYMKTFNAFVTIRNSFIHDNNTGVWGQTYGLNADAGGARTCNYGLLENNVIVNNSYANFGITHEDEGLALDWVIRNNTMYGAQFGIVAPPTGWDIYDNILDNMSNYNIWSYRDGEFASCDHNQFGLTSFNIIYHRYSAGSVTYANLASWQASGELVGGANPGAGSLASDPLFVNGSTQLNLLSDFALGGGSPCINADRAGTGNIGADTSTVWELV